MLDKIVFLGVWTQRVQQNAILYEATSTLKLCHSGNLSDMQSSTTSECKIRLEHSIFAVSSETVVLNSKQALQIRTALLGHFLCNMSPTPFWVESTCQIWLMVNSTFKVWAKVLNNAIRFLCSITTFSNLAVKQQFSHKKGCDNPKERDVSNLWKKGMRWIRFLTLESRINVELLSCIFVVFLTKTYQRHEKFVEKYVVSHRQG